MSEKQLFVATVEGIMDETLKVISIKESLDRARKALENEASRIDHLLHTIENRTTVTRAQLALWGERMEIAVLSKELYMIDDKEAKERMEGTAKADFFRKNGVPPAPAEHMEKAIARYSDKGPRCPRCQGRCNDEMVQASPDDPRRFVCLLCDMEWTE